jgi:hypothetical protein
MPFPVDAGDNLIALCQGPRCNADVAQDVVIHRRFVSRNMGNSACANDQYILFHCYFLLFKKGCV